MAAFSPAPFGRVLTAMITPMNSDGSVDFDGTQRLAQHLADQGQDGLVVNGTTGEASTTTDAEKGAVLRATLDAVGDRVQVLAGVGSNDTAHSIELARQAERLGAHGLLAVTPYYNKPPQSGVQAHFEALADATGLPVMLYDIPGRAGIEIESETLVRLAEHPRIVANKDAKADLEATSWVLARSDLAIYSGDDSLTLPLLAVGAVGVVSVVGHVVGERLIRLVEAYLSGDVALARDLHLELMPVFIGIFRSQGAILTKAALTQLGLPAGPVRLPLVTASESELAQLILDLADGRVDGFTA